MYKFVSCLVIFVLFNTEIFLLPLDNSHITFGGGNPVEEHEHSRSSPSLIVTLLIFPCAPVHVMTGFFGFTVLK